MGINAVELELPFDEKPFDGLAGLRRHHLDLIAGVDETAAQRLARVFPSLAAVYSATEDELRQVVGPVSAARIRWFLDAPLRTGTPRPAA
jgi:ERCC4-type nuclease